MKIRFEHEKPNEYSVWSLGGHFWVLNKKWWGIEVYLGKHLFAIHVN